jgi:predicted RNA binding protein YcfA (HicA-like mRNA interferase family)
LPRPPTLNAREIVRALQKSGFVFSRQRGSHAIMTHPRTGRVAVVPMHGGRDILPETLAGILKQAGLTVEEFLELLR